MQEKRCSKCGESKPLDDFYKNNKKSNKHRAACKVCQNYITKVSNRTLDGLISMIYRGQVRGSKIRNHCRPNYSKKELKLWILSQPNFNDLHNQWVKSNYKKDLKPSCDRIDDYKSYSLDNIKLVTWYENRIRYFIDMKNGINKKRLTPVVQLDLDGNFIKNFNSIEDAKINTNKGSAVWHVCNGFNNSAGGFKWMYKSDYDKLNN